MRKVMTLVALAASAGCGDDGGSVMVDAGPTADMMVVVPPDAPPSIDGVWRETYHTASGTSTVPSCTVATVPSALKVDPVSGQVATYAGSCTASDMFRILAPQDLGTYYLRVQGTLYETNRRGDIDLSGNNLGRSDIAGIAGVTLGLTMTGLQPWTTGDLLVAFGSNIGYRQVLNLTSGAPSGGATTITAGTASWSGYKIDSTKGDTLQLIQLGRHTAASNLDYLTLDRVYTAPAFSMENNMQSAIAGAFTTPTTSTLPLAVNVGSFHQFASVAAPSVTARSVLGTVYAAVASDVIDSPSLVSFAQSSDGFTLMDYGTVTYGDPFPVDWQRHVRIQVGFTVPYTWNGISGSRLATLERVMTKAEASAATITAQLGPPTNVQFDGADALTALSISGVPVVSWDEPTIGTPTDYEIQVYEAKTTSGTMTFSSVLRLVTKSRSVRIPAGYLLGQRQYVFAVRARTRTGVDVATTPLRPGSTWSSAEMLSALVTTSS